MVSWESHYSVLKSGISVSITQSNPRIHDNPYQNVSDVFLKKWENSPKQYVCIYGTEDQIRASCMLDKCFTTQL